MVEAVGSSNQNGEEFQDIIDGKYCDWSEIFHQVVTSVDLEEKMMNKSLKLWIVAIKIQMTIISIKL